MPEESRLIRGKILKILFAAHPEWVEDLELLLKLGDLNCPIDATRLSSELIYLRDTPESHHGYVELQVLKTAGGEEIPQSRITGKGIDLIEKLIPADPRVALF